MKSHHKLYAAVLFLAVALHYVALFAMSTKLGALQGAFYLIVIAGFAQMVWSFGGFNQD